MVNEHPFFIFPLKMKYEYSLFIDTILHSIFPINFANEKWKMKN